MVRVRESKVDDVADVRRVAERGWNAAYETILSADTIAAAMDEWYSPTTVEESIESQEVGYFVAEDDGTVVGYVNGGPERPTQSGVASLRAIYVDPDRWGEGIGTSLLGRFEEFCREREYESVQIWVLSGNDIARSFYEKHGYELAEEGEAELFGETVDESFLTKDL